MPDPETPATPEAEGGSRTWLASIDPMVAICGGIILLCLGVWVGFKLGGETMTEPHVCPECQQREAEARILAQDQPEA